MFDAQFIGQIEYDISGLLKVLQKALGYNPGHAADTSPRKLSKTEKMVSILAAIKDKNSSPDLYPNLLPFFPVGVLIGVDERDLQEVTNLLSGMTFLILTTEVRGVILIITLGTLNQWRDAIITGTNHKNDIQGLFCKLYSLFQNEGLNLWKDCVVRKQDKLFLLEHKRT